MRLVLKFFLDVTYLIGCTLAGMVLTSFINEFRFSGKVGKSNPVQPQSESQPSQLDAGVKLKQPKAGLERNQAINSDGYGIELTELSQKLSDGPTTVSMGWALRAVKNQQKEGACTAYALSGALEALLMSRYQIDAVIDAGVFWDTYRVPTLPAAFRAAGAEGGGLVAEVASSSQFHPYPKGTRLKIILPNQGYEQIGLSAALNTLKERYPILLASTHSDASFVTLSAQKPFVYASSAGKQTGHVWLLSGLSTGWPKAGSVWFHVRNSWGEDWGKKGNALLSAEHCLLNTCTFTAIKNLKINGIEP